MALKFDLDQIGLKLNQDYTWRYQPVKYEDGWSYAPMHESQVVFEFTDPALASFYQIKWSK